MNPHATHMLAVLAAASFAVALPGCGDSKPAGTAKATAADDHGHDHGAGGHDHAPAKPAPAAGDDHGHGAVVQLGEQQVAGFAVRASRDGAIAGATDAPIDVWITGGTGKVVAVRFWVGTQDAKGSVKAKAELEKDNWHTHAELPSPMPAESKLWVEFEIEGGARHVAGFELKA
jgi:hypothetical protein